MAEENNDAAEQESPKKIPLQLIRGLPFVANFIKPSKIEEIIDFKPSDFDIFLVTYPKCGTTWTSFVIWEILHKGAVPPSPNQMGSKYFPFLEFTGLDYVDELPSPRTMKTHLPFNLHPYNPNAKFIYVARNPWDCCVSYYYHHVNNKAYAQVKFDDFFELFIAGEVPYGDFFGHVLSWFEHKNDPNVLFFTYEYMKKDKKKTLLEIAKFLGESYYEGVQDPQVLENCLKHSDFKYMKSLGMFYPKNTSAMKDPEKLKKVFDIDRSTANPEEYYEANFFRKGEVGDWKNHFSASQVQRFNEYMLKKLKGTKMENFWHPQLEETEL